jgi:hypothetical protein
MPRYRRKQDLALISLPWGFEIAIFAVSLISGTVVTVASFWLAVDSRLAPFRQAFGVEIDLAPYLPQFLPFLVIAGLLTGFRFHTTARRWLISKLAFV